MVLEKLTDKNGVEIQVGQECEAYYTEYFNGVVVGTKDDFVRVEDMEGDEFDIDPQEVEVELNLKDVAEDEGLKTIETTTGTNGYPQNIKDAIVGFENFEDALHIAYKYGLNVKSFRKKDGWQLWARDSSTMYRPYRISSEYFGDNYSEMYKMNEEEFMEMEVDEVLKDTEFENMEKLEDFVKTKKELWEEIDSMEDDEVVICLYGEYYDTFKQEALEFRHDTYNYVIGVI